MNKEIFRDIKGYEGLYQISNLGRVKSLGRVAKHWHGGYKRVAEKILKLVKGSCGYLIVGLCKNSKVKHFLVHRLVGIHHIPNPQNLPEINHKKGIKIDNRATELEWTTTSENQKHAYKTGLMTAQGEANGQAKLNEKQVREIKHLKHIKPKILQREIAKIFKISPSIISMIYTEKIWKHITI